MLSCLFYPVSHNQTWIKQLQKQICLPIIADVELDRMIFQTDMEIAQSDPYTRDWGKPCIAMSHQNYTLF